MSSNIILQLIIFIGCIMVSGWMGIVWYCFIFFVLIIIEGIFTGFKM